MHQPHQPRESASKTGSSSSLTPPGCWSSPTVHDTPVAEPKPLTGRNRHAIKKPPKPPPPKPPPPKPPLRTHRRRSKAQRPTSRRSNAPTANPSPNGSNSFERRESPNTWNSSTGSRPSTGWVTDTPTQSSAIPSPNCGRRRIRGNQHQVGCGWMSRPATTSRSRSAMFSRAGSFQRCLRASRRLLGVGLTGGQVEPLGNVTSCASLSNERTSD